MPDHFRCPAIALAALVLLTLAAAPLHASSQSEQATVTISGPTKVAGSAKSVEIHIDVENAANLAGFQFVLNVNPDVVRPVSAEHTTFLTKSGREIFCQSPTIESGALRLACVTLRDSPAGVDGSGTLAVVTLQPSGDGTSALGLSHVKLVRPDGSELPSSAVDGELTVGGSTGGSGWFTWPRAALVAGAAAVLLLLVAAFMWRRRSRGRGAIGADAGDPGSDVP